MRDNECRERIAALLGRIEGVVEVRVSLFRARAVVQHDSVCVASSLIDALESLGYAGYVVTTNLG